MARHFGLVLGVPFGCDACFLFVRTMARHFGLVLGVPFGCDACFLFVRTMARHFGLVLGVPFGCDACFLFVRTMARHFGLVLGVPFGCDACFLFVRTMARHFGLVLGVPFGCDACFLFVRTMARHFGLVLGLPFGCAACSLRRIARALVGRVLRFALRAALELRAGAPPAPQERNNRDHDGESDCTNDENLIDCQASTLHSFRLRAGMPSREGVTCGGCCPRWRWRHPAGTGREADLGAVRHQRTERASRTSRKTPSPPMHDKTYVRSATAVRGHGSLNPIVQLATAVAGASREHARPREDPEGVTVDR